MKIKILYHYPEDDEDGSGDHWGGEVLLDGEEIQHFADAYHENRDFEDGFVSGIAWALARYNIVQEVEIDEERVSDRQGHY